MSSESRTTLIYEAQLFDSQLGGASAHFRAVSSRLAKAGRLHHYQELRPAPDSRLKAVTTAAIRCYRQIRKAKRDGDDVVVLSRMVPVNLVPLAARLAGARVWVELNGPMAEEMTTRSANRAMSTLFRMIGKTSERSQLLFAHDCWAVTPGLADYYATRLAPTRFHIIPNGAEVQDDSDVNLEQGSQIPLFFGGALTPWYDFDPLISVLDRDERFSLVLVGDGQCRPAIAKAGSDLIAQGRLTLRGWLPEEELAAEVARHAVAVIPLVPKSSKTRAIGSPLKLFQYLAAGMVVVAPAVDGIAEIDAPGLLKYDDSNPSSLVETLNYLADNYEELQREARDRDRTVYSWDSRIEVFLDQILGATP